MPVNWRSETFPAFRNTPDAVRKATNTSVLMYSMRCLLRNETGTTITKWVEPVKLKDPSVRRDLLVSPCFRSFSFSEMLLSESYRLRGNFEKFVLLHNFKSALNGEFPWWYQGDRFVR